MNDVSGFSKSASFEDVRDKGYVLTPGRYVGLPEEDDDFDFAECFTVLQKEFSAQLEEERRLNALIQENLAMVEIPIEGKK